MKTILLLRHGKSDWANPVPDHGRPLNKRGRKAAALMGRFLARAGELPQLVITSSALRARDTVALAIQAGEWERTVVVRDALYESSPEDVLAGIRSENDGVNSVLLAGHEPTWSELASGLCGGLRLRLPTAAVVRIDVDVDRWRAVELGGGEMVWLVTPRLLAGG